MEIHDPEGAARNKMGEIQVSDDEAEEAAKNAKNDK